MLQRLLPEVQSVHIRNAAGEAMPSPGLLEKHYSPRTPLTLFEGPAPLAALIAATQEAQAKGQTVGLLVADPPGLAQHARGDLLPLGARGRGGELVTGHEGDGVSPDGRVGISHGAKDREPPAPAATLGELSGGWSPETTGPDVRLVFTVRPGQGLMVGAC